MKRTKLTVVTVSAALALFLVAASSTRAQSDPTKNVIKNGDMESYQEGPVPQEDFGVFWAPVNAALMDKNTFFNFVKDKDHAHSGEMSLKIALTPETAQLWQANTPPDKQGDSMWLHYSFRQRDAKNAATLLASPKIVFSIWVFVEKGAFQAHLQCRDQSANTDEPNLIRGDISVDEVGKWVQVKVYGRGHPNVTKGDIRMEIESRGDFVVYLDDAYYGPAD